MSISAPQTVVKGIQVAAAFSQLTPAGSFTTARAGAIARSANTAYSSNMKAGMTATGSPIANPSTSGPTASIVPAAS
ncbi:hypothetical protein D3C71_1744050 [compost metagenome]